jgi:NitT/TauT family transport system permease protein
MSETGQVSTGTVPAPTQAQVRRPAAQQKLAAYLPAIIIFVAVLVSWEVLVRLFNIQQFLLPRPTVILAAFVNRFGELMQIGFFTFREALGGFVIGCSLGILVALATARWTVTREVLLPFAIAANSVPIVAFAPVMNNWFGVTNPLSKMMVVAVIVFFPMMINTVRGLTYVDAGVLELMRSYAASEFQILGKVRIPNAYPYIFSAFKVCSTLSLIGAVVAEFFGGPRAALGVFITQEAALFRFDNAWAAIIVASILGIVFYGVVLIVERWAMPWHISLRDQD